MKSCNLLCSGSLNIWTQNELDNLLGIFAIIAALTSVVKQSKESC